MGGHPLKNELRDRGDINMMTKAKRIGLGVLLIAGIALLAAEAMTATGKPQSTEPANLSPEVTPAGPGQKPCRWPSSQYREHILEVITEAGVTACDILDRPAVTPEEKRVAQANLLNLLTLLSALESVGRFHENAPDNEMTPRRKEEPIDTGWCGTSSLLKPAMRVNQQRLLDSVTVHGILLEHLTKKD